MPALRNTLFNKYTAYESKEEADNYVEESASGHEANGGCNHSCMHVHSIVM